jgi:predicted transcriptional regulator
MWPTLVSSLAIGPMIQSDQTYEDETLASVRRGIADIEAGRTYDLDEVFDELDAESDDGRR